jgi:hypothetical protein
MHISSCHRDCVFPSQPHGRSRFTLFPRRGLGPVPGLSGGPALMVNAPATSSRHIIPSSRTALCTAVRAA